MKKHTLWESYKAWRTRQERKEIKSLKAQLYFEAELRKKAEQLALSAILKLIDAPEPNEAHISKPSYFS